MTTDVLCLAIAGVAATAGWLLPRRVAGAGFAEPKAALLDGLPLLFFAGLLLLATARPLFAGLAVLAAGGGFALADRAKREALREPVVFSDASELRHVFTHPHLYLPFAGPTAIIGGALASVGFGIFLLACKSGLWQPAPLSAAVLLAGAAIIAWKVSRDPLLSAAAALLRRLEPTGQPLADAARLGPFAVLLVYGIIARAERAERRARHVALPAPAVAASGTAVPIVVVQCESFFDARRMTSQMPDNLLPGFDACVRRGATYGRLGVSAWGANTMRSEFAVLTGIPEDRLGYDRFNPYHAYARAPLASLASHLRGEGYRTLCLHPFDRSFFGRDVIMPGLGFDAFLGRDELGGSRRPPYRSDPDLARQVLEVLDGEMRRTFVFVITMGNHGPWSANGGRLDPGLSGRLDLAGVPQGKALLRYLEGLGRSDEMLQILLDGVCSRRGGLLALYGDHLPSLPHAFDHFGFTDWASDYVLVEDGAASGSRRVDLPAHRLPWVILDRLRERGAIRRQCAVALGAA